MGADGGDELRRTLVVYTPEQGRPRAVTPQAARELGLRLVAASPTERRELRRLGYRF